MELDQSLNFHSFNEIMENRNLFENSVDFSVSHTPPQDNGLNKKDDFLDNYQANQNISVITEAKSPFEESDSFFALKPL